MKVYIEYVLADNFFMDWLLLKVSAKALKYAVRPFRLWVSALLGSVGAVAISLVESYAWGIIAKTALFFCMSTVAFLHDNVKKSLGLAIAFGVFTFLAGGIIVGLFFLFGVDFVAGATLSCFTQLPVGLILLGLVAFVALVQGIVKEGKKQRKLKSFGCEVSFFLFGKRWELQGIFDSGNSLTAKDGLPVCFLCACPACERIKKAISQGVAVGAPPKNMQFVSFATVQGEGKALAFEAEEFFIDGRRSRCLMAFGNSRGDGFDVLVNLYLLQGF